MTYLEEEDLYLIIIILLIIKYKTAKNLHCRVAFADILSIFIMSTITMDIENMWILWQGKFSRQLSLLICNSFIGKFVHPLEGKGRG